jgi:hypothetical protein
MQQKLTSSAAGQMFVSIPAGVSFKMSQVASEPTGTTAFYINLELICSRFIDIERKRERN